MFSILVDQLMRTFLAPPGGEAAYLDPGSGSILIQLLVAGALGALIVLRTSWGRIRSLFGRGAEAEDEENGDDEE